MIVINHRTQYFILFLLNRFSVKYRFPLKNFAFFTVKSPSVTKRSVSEESAFKKCKNPSAFFSHKTIGSINSFIPFGNNFRLLR